MDTFLENKLAFNVVLEYKKSDVATDTECSVPAEISFWSCYDTAKERWVWLFAFWLPIAQLK